MPMTTVMKQVTTKMVTMPMTTAMKQVTTRMATMQMTTVMKQVMTTMVTRAANQQTTAASGPTSVSSRNAMHQTTPIPITQTARIVRLQATFGWSENQTMEPADT